MTIGTVGVKELAGKDWVYSFFFMSMVATGQGPPTNVTGNYAEIFVSIMAFISVGTLITSIGVIFGPFFGYLFHKGVKFSEREIEKLEKEGKGKKNSVETSNNI
jgi:H+/gluconate symporter-like permease